MAKTIYLDNAATTPVKPEVLDAMMPYFTEKFGNPSAVYSFAAENKNVVTTARRQLLKPLEQIHRIFTLLLAVLSPITGHLRQLRRLIGIKEII